MLTKLLWYSILTIETLKASQKGVNDLSKITLKAARVNAKLTQKEAAKKLKISNKTLCNWENGASMPKADKIDAICALYSIPYDQLIFFKPNNA